MTECTHRFLDALDGLACTREAGHVDGHTYAASDAPDRHVEGVDD